MHQLELLALIGISVLNFFSKGLYRLYTHLLEAKLLMLLNVRLRLLWCIGTSHALARFDDALSIPGALYSGSPGIEQLIKKHSFFSNRRKK